MLKYLIYIVSIIMMIVLIKFDTGVAVQNEILQTLLKLYVIAYIFYIIIISIYALSKLEATKSKYSTLVTICGAFIWILASLLVFYFVIFLINNILINFFDGLDYISIDPSYGLWIFVILSLIINLLYANKFRKKLLLDLIGK